MNCGRVEYSCQLIAVGWLSVDIALPIHKRDEIEFATVEDYPMVGHT